ncbi:unnamed protein product [Victoria cruziana]
MVATLKTEIELKSPADKLWKAITESTELFPKIFPEQYKSITIVEGDGKSVGTIREIKYGEGVPIVTFGKEKVLVADEENKTVSYTVVDGEILSFFKVFTPTVKVLPSDDGKACKVVWDVEYEKANDEVGEPTMIQEFAVNTLKALDEHVLAAAA